MSADTIAKEIFLSAIEIDRQDQRDAFVTGACRGDEALYREVIALLEAHFEKDSWLDPRVHREALQPTAILAARDSLSGVSVGAQIGNYKLLEQIGAGGMGIVYMAEQIKPIRRKVALKVIKPGMDTGQVVARFEAERQALALMDHPNIARVLDAGATETGRPYFVMELVRGIPITEYCDKNRLNTRDRLRLFSSVCQAVQHAHNKGIIHRDIKPSNVLVTLHDGVPVPKIIDFGVAKAINQQLTDRTLFTSFAQFVGTPLYMSPEQAEMSGLDVDTRSDVYSLGVLLYELLTGTTPFDRTRLHQAALDEVRRIIREEEPPRPSTRVSSLGSESTICSMQRSTDPVKLKQLLLRELDWIVMKTLEKDRTRRYETVNQLASEIDRYLDGQPVQACPPSTLYILRKFAYRYRTPVAIAAGFLLLILGASALSLMLAARARQSRDLALAAQVESQRQRDHALAAERNAAKHLEVASRERERADQHAQELKQKLYDYSLIKANAAYRDRDFKTVFSSISDCLPEQRGWEWHFLHRQSNGVRAIPLEGNNHVEFDITPDLTRALVADAEGNLRCVRLSDGRVEWSRKCQITIPSGSAISADNQLFVLTGSRRLSVHRESKQAAEEGMLEAFDVATGQPLWSQSVVGSATTFLPSFCRGDTQLLVTAMGAAGCTIQLRSTQRGEIAWSAPALNFAQAVMNNAGTRIYISETQQQEVTPPSRLRCIDVESKSEIWTVERLDEATGIRLSQDGRELLATGKNLSLAVYDANTGEAKQTLASSISQPGLLVTGGHIGNYVLTVGRTGQFVVWDWHTKRPLEVSQSMSASLGLRVSADESQLAFLRPEERLLLIRPLRPTSEPLTLIGHKTGFKSARFLEGNKLGSVGNEGALRIWDASSGQELTSAPLEAEGFELDVATEAGWIATATSNGTKVWDASTRKLLQHWPQDGPVWFVKTDSTASVLATAGEQGVLRIYRGEGAVENRQWPTQVSTPSLERKTSSPIQGLAVTSDGSKVFTLNSPGCEVNSWNVASGQKLVLRPSQSTQSGRTLEVSPDGKILAVAVERSVELWDLETNQQKKVLRDAESNVLSLAFDRTGTRLVAGTSAGYILLWNLASGERLLNYPAHDSYVVSLAFSLDNQQLLSSSYGGELKLWETQKLTPEVAAARDLVQHATLIANRLIVQHRTPKAALSHLLTADSVPEGLLPTVTAVLQTRLPAPINLNALSVATDKKPGETGDSGNSHSTVAPSISGPALKEKIDALLAKSLPDILHPTDRGPDSMAANNWNSLCRRLVQPSTFKLQPAELIERLQHIKEGGDAPHYIHYLKAIAHLQIADYEPAAIEMSQALNLVPEESPLWFTYSFRLSFLLAYVRRWDDYNQLCTTALEDFHDDSDAMTLERLAKMSLFSKHSPDLDAALSVADRALAQTESIAFKVFVRLTKGIAELRRKNYAVALEHLDFALKYGMTSSSEGHRITLATAHVYSAIALSSLGRQDEARRHIAEAEPVLRDFPATSGWWPDWMLASIVFNEAQELLDGPDASSP